MWNTQMQNAEMQNAETQNAEMQKTEMQKTEINKTEILHFIPGRVRLKVPALRQNTKLASELRELAEKELKGVHRFQVNTTTGSIIVEFDHNNRDGMNSIARLLKDRADVFGIDLSRLQEQMQDYLGRLRGEELPSDRSQLASSIESAVVKLNERVKQSVGNVGDLRELLPLALLAASVGNLLSDKKPMPAWANYLWISFATYSAFHPHRLQPEPKQETEDAHPRRRPKEEERRHEAPM